MTKALSLVLLTYLASSMVQAAPSIALQSGQAANFSSPANSFTTAYYIDVQASDEKLTIALNTATAGVDIDILVRFGSPFPDTTLEGSVPDPTFLAEIAHYRGVSSLGNEVITLDRSQVQPLRAGRWFIAVLNLSATTTNTSVTATRSIEPIGNLPITILFDDTSNSCDVAGWNDTTPRAATGGNSGTTLGQQRRNAILEAARLLSLQLKSNTPIKVRACWQDLGTGNSVVLAQAGTNYIIRNDISFYQSGNQELSNPNLRNVWMPKSYAWHSAAPSAKLSGTPLCGYIGTNCTVTDIRATFNTKIDTTEALGSRLYYYGFTPQGPLSDVDFIGVAMHEITHGLGFQSFINKDPADGPVGQKQSGFDDAFSLNVTYLRPPNFSPTPFAVLTDAERETAMTSVFALRWSGPEATNSALSPVFGFVYPDNLLGLHAPTQLASGSTLSHISAEHPGQLMLANASGAPRTLGASLPILHDVGWNPKPRTAPTYNVARARQYYDVMRGGHGIDFGLVAGTTDTYFLVLYSYAANGQPEWYLAIGKLIDGVFVPTPNANGDSLVRYSYNAANNPRQSADPTFDGNIRLDFNQAAGSPTCQKDASRRDSSGLMAVMTWSINADKNQKWCMQPLLPDALIPTQDLTGTWYSDGDSGWGFSITNFKSGTNTGLFAVLYYPDSTGAGRWAFAFTDNYQSGTPLTFKQRTGYCRTCALPPGVESGNFNDANNGTISLTLTQPSASAAAGNRVTFTANYLGTSAGTFTRSNLPIQLLTQPPQ